MHLDSTFLGKGLACVIICDDLETIKELPAVEKNKHKIIELAETLMKTIFDKLCFLLNLN